MFFRIIICISKRYGFAYKKKVPWNIKEELNYFKNKTLNTINTNKKNAVVMGRKTFEHILNYHKNGLPNRLNIVLSNNEELKKKYQNNINIQIINTFEELEILIEKYKILNTIETFWFIGGISILEYAINKKYDIYLSKINEEYLCDIYLDKNIFNNYKIIYKITKTFLCKIKNKNVEVDFMKLVKKK